MSQPAGAGDGRRRAVGSGAGSARTPRFGAHVVQRTPEYVGRAGVDPNRRKLATRGLDADIGSGKDETDPKKLYENPLLENFELRPVSPTASAREISINRIFGRRFKPVYMRWLSASEI